MVIKIIEDEYIVTYGKHYDVLNMTWNIQAQRMVPDIISFSIITCPGDDLRILLMDMVWQAFGIQLGYHQVVNLLETT